MREIKFRGWDKRENIMFEVRAIDWSDGVIISCHSDSRKYYPGDMGDHIEFLQYTGLKDKNGKEIYEGDIVGVEKEVVKFGECQVSMGEYECYGFYLDDEYKEVLTKSYAEVFEVFGNIYENPELLNHETK